MHPHHEHRQHKVERSRAKEMTRGYASGGRIPEPHHPDEKADVGLVKKMVKKTSLKVDGAKPKHRADRMQRAKGGRTNKKGTNVTVVVAPQGQGGGARPMPVPMPPPGAAAPPMAAPPPRPPMPPPGPGMMPPGAMPPGMPPRRHGGRTYATGGAVKDGPTWKEGVRNGTQVTHRPGKNDLADIGRGKPITYATGGQVSGRKLVSFYASGGPVEARQGIEPDTRLPGGSGGGEARLVKEKRARKDYKAA